MPKSLLNVRTTREGAGPALDIRRYAPALGAEVWGVDLAGGLDRAACEQVRAALLAHRAIWDYWPEPRKGRRVTIKGDRPEGIP